MAELKELLKDITFIKDKYNIKADADFVITALKKYIADDAVRIITPAEYLQMPQFEDWMDIQRSFTVKRHGIIINNKVYFDLKTLSWYLDHVISWCIPLRKRNKDFIKCFFLSFRIMNIIEDKAKKFKKDCKRKKI